MRCQAAGAVFGGRRGRRSGGRLVVVSLVVQLDLDIGLECSCSRGASLGTWAVRSQWLAGVGSQPQRPWPARCRAFTQLPLPLSARRGQPGRLELWGCDTSTGLPQLPCWQFLRVEAGCAGDPLVFVSTCVNIYGGRPASQLCPSCHVCPCWTRTVSVPNSQLYAIASLRSGNMGSPPHQTWRFAVWKHNASFPCFLRGHMADLILHFLTVRDETRRSSRLIQAWQRGRSWRRSPHGRPLKTRTPALHVNPRVLLHLETRLPK